MKSLASLALASLSLVSLSSCFEDTYKVAESEVLVRYLPEKDELLVLEIEHGIEEGGKTPDPMNAAADGLRAIAKGERVYPASGNWFAADFDELLRRAGEPTEKEVTEKERADLTEFVAAVHVEDHGLYLDGERGLEHFRRVAQIASDFINRSFRKDGANALPAVPGFPFFDEASREMFRSAIAGDHAWLSTQKDAVVLDLPMTSVSAARCLAWVAGEGRAPNESADELLFYQQASSIEVVEGHARLRFGEASRPVARFDYHSTGAESSAPLIAWLRKTGVELGGSEAPKKALAWFEAAPAQMRSK
jgi:hypothetical protein